LKGKEEEETRR